MVKIGELGGQEGWEEECGGWEDDGGGEGDILQITSKPTTTLSQI